MSSTLFANAGLLDFLKVLMRCGWRRLVPKALDRAETDASCLGHHAPGPMGGVFRRLTAR